MIKIINMCVRLTLCCVVVVTSVVNADQSFNDDIIIKGSLCVGTDCSVGENFNFDTIRLKENNLRIKFQDTSTSSSFPTRDWEMGANESANGGKNLFYIQNNDIPSIPFIIEDGAGTNSIYVKNNGWVGFNTSTPAATLHVTTGNSPTLRLDQDGSSGFTAQTWDVAGNETNFFIRDATNNKLPLRITTGASNASIFVAADGDVGFETTTPDGMFDIAHPSDANNHAVLISAAALFGINIDNGFVPRGQFDIQKTGGKSTFMVTTDGKVGIGMDSANLPVGPFEIESVGVTKFLVDNEYDVGIGKAPAGRFLIASSDATKNYFAVDANGKVGIGTETISNYFGAQPNLELKSAAGSPSLMGLGAGDDTKVAALLFQAGGVDKWALSSRHNFNNSPGSTVDRIGFFNASALEVFTLHQNGSVYLGNSPGTNNNTSHALEAASGAHLTTGGVWTDASSRSYKEDIEYISANDAALALSQLEPVTYTYKREPGETYAGFIAEDVPDLVATNDRKSLAPMDIVAVLTKVLKEQQVLVKEQQKTIETLHSRLEKLEAKD